MVAGLGQFPVNEFNLTYASLDRKQSW